MCPGAREQVLCELGKMGNSNTKVIIWEVEVSEVNAFADHVWLVEESTKCGRLRASILGVKSQTFIEAAFRNGEKI